MTKIDYVMGISGSTHPLDALMLNRLLDSPEVKNAVYRVRNGDVDAKKQMPAVCWQASFTGGKRNNQNAVMNGLFCLDIDHYSPDEVWNRCKGREDELDLYAVHKSPGGDGAHIVAGCNPEFTTIAENQKWLAGELGIPYDPVCKDAARFFNLTTRDEFYYLNMDMFEDFQG